EEGRFAGVCVTDDRDHGERYLAALCPVQFTRAPNSLQLALDAQYALLQEPPVGLDLRLARAAHEPAAATLPLQMRPASDEPAALIFKVGKIDLEAPFLGARTAPENLQDQSGAVEHLRL